MAGRSDSSGGGSASASTDSSLLVRLRGRDQDAWDDMLHIYYPLVYGWCRRNGLASEDVLDVVQEVFRAVLSGIGDFRRRGPADSFRGWLRGITRHKLLDFFRQRARSEQAGGGSAHYRRMAAVADPLPDDSADELPAWAAAVHRALDHVRPEFEPRTWQAFWRVQIDDEPPARVAASLEMTINAVYKAKARVLQRLRQQLGDLDQ